MSVNLSQRRDVKTVSRDDATTRRGDGLAQRRNCAAFRSLVVMGFLIVSCPAFGAFAQEPPHLTVAAGGDVMFGRLTETGLVTIEDADPFAEVKEQLMAADLAIVNLETALCDAPPRAGLRPTFTAPTELAALLAEAGVDVAVLANNHSLDCGVDGLAQTIDALRAVGITPLGAATQGSPLEPTVIEVGGRRVALLAATLILPNRALSEENPDPDWSQRIAYLSHDDATSLLPVRIGTARETYGADLVVIALHWGAEGATAPSSSQVELAHLLVDSGVDLVLGHHAHVMQQTESYHRGTIAYCLGNLVFDSPGRGDGILTFIVP